MALTSWKSFNFFTVTPVRPADEPENAPPPFQGADITALTAGSDNLFLGTSDGRVQVVSSAFKIARTFSTAEGGFTQGTGAITHLKQIEGSSLLVTISEDLSSEPVLKVWALDKVEKKTGDPKCLSSLTVNNGRKQYPATAFAATPSLSLLAVGFANGSITLIKGDLIHDRGTRQRIIFESEEPITNLCFSPPSDSGRGQRHAPPIPGNDGGETLYVSTTARVLTLQTHGKAVGQPRVLESQGCGVGCMTPAVDFTSDERGLRDGGEIVVARDDALYFYGPNGRGACYSYEGPKQSIQVFKNYIALISPPASRPSTAVATHRGHGVSATLKRFVGQTSTGVGSDDLFDTTKFTLVDTELKFIAHSERLISGVKETFISWGDFFVLTLDGKLYRYHEVSLQEKLDILYARNLYVLAINLAQKAGWYIKALGPANEEGVSTVIRKFLDTQRIHNLIEYLEELHKHDAATSDHTTLLLNCYAKLKDIDKLEAFIKHNPEEGLKFDVDTAIGMCRQAGYYEQAVYLAEKQQEHDIVVSIMVENLGNINDTLDYIQRLEPEVAYPNLMKYARVFLQKAPQSTTDALVEYYTGRYIPRKKETQGTAAPQAKQQDGGFQSYLNSSLLQQLPYMPGVSQTNTPTQAGASPAKGTAQTPSPGETGTKPLDLPKQYQIPKPRTAFSSFVDHPVEFVDFLERILQDGESTGKLNENDRIDIYTTLFEIYLQRANATKNKDEKRKWEAKAKKIIESKEALVDTSNVLLLSHLADFKDGTTLVREKQGLRFDIFRSCCSAGDTAGAVRALKKYGSEEPELYPAALSYFTSSPKVLREVGEEELGRVLKVIDEQGLMKPLQVVQTLSSNGVATVGMVKRYLGDTIDRERREIQNNRKMIDTYRQETTKKSADIAELGSKPTVFQAQRCQACGLPLDLPTVHFLCKHSFHQRCLNAVDGESLECITCAPTNQTIRTLKRGQEEVAEKHDLFKTTLADGKDKFAVISDFFGKGVMAAPPPLG
ncbi:hypothetical protein FN846DRAFT_902926 [Sphaerosporella brunnea]|uniref:E3 ubiquitin-protein ligase PEP5 n=1 Tax=Sphaerosporella brunnea TaxID=1250544 RepID=A0A5J5F8N4_9PEZI|nr:hypothetical protein FN846DRAFT_902926 [Sphaerosporella brunnea]